MRKITMMSLLFLFCSNAIQAQGESAVPFVLIQPSTQLNGMAGAYTALPTNDTYGAYYNPAQLGFFSQTENFSYQSMKIKWLPDFNFDDLYYKAKGFQIGYNLKNIKSNIPLSIGIGYMRGYLNLGENVWTDETGAELGTFNSREWYDAYSIGVNYTYFADFSIGITHKSIVSKLGPKLNLSNNVVLDNEAKAKAYDLGLLISLPVHKFYSKMFEEIQGEDFKLSPLTRFSVGIVKANIGDEIAYLDHGQKDPLPRQAKIGYGINLGLNMEFKDMRINLISFQYASEANDILIKRDTSGNFKYQSFPGNINIFQNIIENKANSKVLNRHGYNLNLFEIVKISEGKFHGTGFDQIRTNGYSISIRGFLKVIAEFYPSPVVRQFLPHFDIVYNKSNYDPNGDDHPLNGTKFESITISVFGF